jgi:hypothetical protein
VERADKRWEHGVCFDNGDGTNTYLCYGAPVNYADASGNWQEIDNRWKQGVAPWDLQMTDCQYKAYALKRFDAGRIVRLEKNSHYITYQPMTLGFTNDLDQIQQIAIPQQVQGTVTDYGSDAIVQGGEIRWVGAYGAGLDFVYTPSTHFFSKILEVETLARLGAPQQFILDSGNACLSLSFIFASDLDLWVDNAKWDARSKVDTANTVEFRDAAGVTHWTWRVPSATDAGGNNVTGKLRIKKQGASLYVSVLMPWSWLQGAVYPVQVDPDTYYGTTNDNTTRASNSDYATAHSSGGSVSPVGNNALDIAQAFSSPTYFVYRAYLEFNTSGIDDALSVSQANLYLTCISDSTATDFNVRIHKFDWASPLSSANMLANWTGALSAAYDADWRGTAGITTNTSYGSPDLDTSWVQKAGTTRYALLSSLDVSSTPPTAYETFRIASQNHTTEAYRPYLSITTGAGEPAGAPLAVFMHHYRQMRSA